MTVLTTRFCTQHGRQQFADGQCLKCRCEHQKQLDEKRDQAAEISYQRWLVNTTLEERIKFLYKEIYKVKHFG